MRAYAPSGCPKCGSRIHWHEQPNLSNYSPPATGPFFHVKVCGFRFRPDELTRILKGLFASNRVRYRCSKCGFIAKYRMH